MLRLKTRFLSDDVQPVQLKKNDTKESDVGTDVARNSPRSVSLIKFAFQRNRGALHHLAVRARVCFSQNKSCKRFPLRKTCRRKYGFSRIAVAMRAFSHFPRVVRVKSRERGCVPQRREFAVEHETKKPGPSSSPPLERWRVNDGKISAPPREIRGDKLDREVSSLFLALFFVRMKYPFNKPSVIRRLLGTAADILLHSYTARAHPPSLRGFLPRRECKEDVRGRVRIRFFVSPPTRACSFPCSHFTTFFAARIS